MTHHRVVGRGVAALVWLLPRPAPIVRVDVVEHRRPMLRVLSDLGAQLWILLFDGGQPDSLVLLEVCIWAELDLPRVVELHPDLRDHRSLILRQSGHFLRLLCFLGSWHRF